MATVCAFAGAVAAILSGKDVNWDLLNYHYYNGWAAWNGKTWFHVFPAHIQSLYNPVFDILQYLLIDSVAPWAVAVVLGGFQGLGLGILYALGSQLVSPQDVVRHRTVLLCCAVAGAASPLAVSLMGSTMADLTLTIPVLAALWAVFSAMDKDEGQSLRLLAVAGALLGAVTGAKLSFAYCPVGAAVALGVLPPPALSRWKALAGLAGAGGAGFLVVAGPWMWTLYERFANPFFPFLGFLFDSVWANPQGSAEIFRPMAGLGEVLRFPFSLGAFGLHRMEIASRGWHFPLAWGAVGLALALRLVKRTGSGNVQDRRGSWLILFFAVSYGVWAMKFAYYRYLVPLEVLSPLVGLVVLRRLRLSPGLLGKAAVLLAAAMGLTASTEGWERTGWRAPSYFNVRLPPRPILPDTMVLMASIHPHGFIVPFLPDGVRAVRIGGNLNRFIGQAMRDRIDETVRRHEGPFLLLTQAPVRRSEDAQLKRVGLARRPESCLLVWNTSGKRLGLCEVERLEDRARAPHRRVGLIPRSSGG